MRTQTRIVGGTFGGRRLVTPAGTHTRPTSEKVRAALASSLTAAGALTGARVLDLYAGSGALGLELVSRGAAAAVFVERDAQALAALRANVATFSAAGGQPGAPHPPDASGGPDPSDGGGPAELIVAAIDAQAFARTQAARLGPFDVVVADPPYAVATEAVAGVLTALHAAGALDRHADVVVERGLRGTAWAWPSPFQGEKLRRYGDTALCYGRAP